MFCFQCEQTALGKGCTVMGVCGKREETAILQDKIVSALIDIANHEEKNDKNTEFIINGLFMTITNVNFDNEFLQNFFDKLKNEYYYEKTFDINSIWSADENIRSLKSIILFGLKGMAAYAYHARLLCYQNDVVDSFLYEGLQAISKDLSKNELGSLVLKTGEVNLKCMEMLDRANTETFGKPTPTTISTEIEAGAFIVVSGHDLKDLALLLEQTKDKSINIYTHGEMLPAHAYPELKKYPHLKGNFGTAWQNQQKEFENIPAPILFTTNCIMPIRESYADKVFTTSVVSYPNVVHIDENKDFTPLIEKAIELGGYKELQHNTGINGGNLLTVGFGHDFVIENLSKIIDGIKSGEIRHIFLVGGCDGAKSGRNYYTEFVEQIPKDTLILTLACGKYRFNDMDLGEINGLPRIIDMGQCNDAYSAIKVAIELSKAFNCTINELPLSFILSWYEQKAVCVLLTLLYLGIENIRLGPSLPAFLSENVLKMLVKIFKIKPITTPKQDLEDILGV